MRSIQKLSRYGAKKARGGSTYWDKMRAVIDQENRECAIRMEARRKAH